MIGIIFLMSLVSAEVNLWEDILISETDQTVTEHSYYQFDDTSVTNIGFSKDVQVILGIDVEALPFDAGTFVVDWCNWTIKHTKNRYSSLGNHENASTEITNNYYSSNSSSSELLYFELKDKDSLVSDVVCHYNDSNNLYQDNVLIGKVTTFFPAFECDECEEFTLEELSNEVERLDQTIEDEVEVYDNIQTAIGWNFEIWLILFWIFKLIVVFIALSMVFAVVYYMYMLVRNVERKIK